MKKSKLLDSVHVIYADFVADSVVVALVARCSMRDQTHVIAQSIDDNRRSRRSSW